MDQLKKAERVIACQHHQKATAPSRLRLSGKNCDPHHQQTEQRPGRIKDVFHFCPKPSIRGKGASEQKYPGESFNDFTEFVFLYLRDTVHVRAFDTH